MTCKKIIEIKHREPTKALESLNRITGLNWESHPASLLPNGLVINGVDDQNDWHTLERKRA